MIAAPPPRLRHLARQLAAAVRARVTRWTRPVPLAVALGAASDGTRSRADLLLENALLRHQLAVLGRAAKRLNGVKSPSGTAPWLTLLRGRIRG